MARVRPSAAHPATGTAPISPGDLGELDLRRLLQCRHICIIGSPGSGKTTLARALQVILQVPLVQMDDIGFNFHQQLGREPTPAEWLEALDQALSQPRLITDGFYKLSLERRFLSADVVIHYDLHPCRCLLAALQRALHNLIVPTSAHLSTRISLRARLAYCFSPRLYTRIMQFRKLYGATLQRHFASLDDHQLLLRLVSRSEARDLVQRLRELAGQGSESCASRGPQRCDG